MTGKLLEMGEGIKKLVLKGKNQEILKILLGMRM